MRALLDVNVSIALLDGAHQHHGAARAWLEANIEYGWATCPITQNGCVRIMSQPAYPGAEPSAAIAGRLRDATETEWHAFWPDAVSLIGSKTLDWRHVLGARQLTDLYLLALAAHPDTARRARPVPTDRPARGPPARDDLLAPLPD